MPGAVSTVPPGRRPSVNASRGLHHHHQTSVKQGDADEAAESTCILNAFQPQRKDDGGRSGWGWVAWIGKGSLRKGEFEFSFCRSEAQEEVLRSGGGRSDRDKGAERGSRHSVGRGARSSASLTPSGHQQGTPRTASRQSWLGSILRTLLPARP